MDLIYFLSIFLTFKIYNINSLSIYKLKTLANNHFY